MSFELLEAILKRCIDLKDLIVGHKQQSNSEQQQLQSVDDKRQMFLDSLAHGLPDVKNIITVRQNLVLVKEEEKDADDDNDNDDVDMEDDEEGERTLVVKWCYDSQNIFLVWD